jgi:hypothetical protein
MAIFGSLLFLGIVFPGFLTTVWLLFPANVQRASWRIEHTPWRCFITGSAALIFVMFPIGILVSLPGGPAKFLGWSLAVIVLALSSLGAAGLAGYMGEGMRKHTHPTSTPLNVFLRGAIALELAAAFPLIGWFIVIPITTIICLGATVFALTKWMPAMSKARENERFAEQMPELQGVSSDALTS